MSPGLSIASSQVTLTALKLNLSNGGAVTILGADKFTYLVGGNSTIAPGGVGSDYRRFVEVTLGVSLPSSGVSAGGAVVIGEKDAASLLASTIVGDDYVFLQYASTAIVGAGLGNDTYLLSNSLLPAGANLTISDALGINSIQLASGLSIKSSQVTSSALKLILNSGATVTILGGDKFTYDVGGNTTAGVDHPDVSYADFVQKTLGVNIPSSGVLSGGAVLIVGNDSLPPQDDPLVQAESKSVRVFGVDGATLLGRNSMIVQSLDASTQNADWQWKQQKLTYSFDQSIPVDYVTNEISTPGWRPLSDGVQKSADAYMLSVGELIDLEISRVAANGDIRFNSVIVDSEELIAYAYLPSNYWSPGGDVFLSNNIGLDYQKNNDIRPGGYGSFTINHEIGHALGLKHPFYEMLDPSGDVDLPKDLDHRVNTIMSYTNHKDDLILFDGLKNFDGSSSVTTEWGSVFPVGFMVYDIAALQAIYGANLSSNLENTTYYFQPNDTVRIALHEEGAVYFNLPGYQTIWDAGGVDTLDFSMTKNMNIIDLSPGSYSDINYRSIKDQITDQQKRYVELLGTNHYDAWVANVYDSHGLDVYTGEKSLGIAYGVIIENVVGGSAGDVFYDNHVNNLLHGNQGDDVFYLGSGGFDSVVGGDGRDTVMVNVPFESVLLELSGSGETLLVADQFAATLVGIELIRFSDRDYEMARATALEWH